MKIGRLYILVLIALCSLCASCMKEPGILGVPTPYPYAVISDMKKMYQGTSLTLHANEIKGLKKLCGIVVSNNAGGNIPAGKVAIQDANGGILLDLGSNTDMPFAFGDSLLVSFDGAVLERKNGMLQISGLSLNTVTKVGSGKTIDPVKMTLRSLADSFDRYESTLVSIAGADVMNVGAGDKYEGTYGLNDGSGTPGEIQLHTEATAAFAHYEIPGMANFTGLAFYHNPDGDQKEGAGKQVWMRTKDDVAITGIPYSSPVIITGFLSDSRGSDCPIVGAVSGNVTHSGGYEYIQFMALRDINFSETPFSVVTCNNGTATAKGWAEGGARTYKFNLSSGFAAKGTFFYVGANSKVIAGYNATNGKSTDISGANWARTIVINVGTTNPATITGDGFGDSNGGFLGNSSPADGIAIFEGTEVTAESVPVDALFYGTTVGTTFSNGMGYRVPDNDHYSKANGETGEAQPFFGQGTNTYVFKQPNTDVSSFSKLGGVITAGSWITPRETTLIDLPLTATLPDIETAVGVTFFRH